MARIGSQGIVDDGSANLSVSGHVTAGAGVRNSPSTLDGTTSVTISNPGFYYVAASGTSGQGAFTGSVPSAANYPGSMLFISDTYGLFNWLLTGSSYATGKAVFTRSSGSIQGGIAGNYGGTAISLTPSASIAMFSDGFRWCVMGGSGSFTISGVNL